MNTYIERILDWFRRLLRRSSPDEGEDLDYPSHPVTWIKGVGPVTAEKFTSNGIHDTSRLLSLSASEVAYLTGLSLDRVETIASAAYEQLRLEEQGEEL